MFIGYVSLNPELFRLGFWCVRCILHDLFKIPVWEIDPKNEDVFGGKIVGCLRLEIRPLKLPLDNGTDQEFPQIDGIRDPPFVHFGGDQQ